MNDVIGSTALAHHMEERHSGLVAPSRRTLILGTGVLTLGAGFAASTAPASAAPILRKGSRGSAVLKLQKDLTRLKYWLGTADGSGERYYSGGRWKRATTPTGDFRMYRLHSRGWQEGPWAICTDPAITTAAGPSMAPRPSPPTPPPTAAPASRWPPRTCCGPAVGSSTVGEC